MISPFSVEEKQKLIETQNINDKMKILEEIVNFAIFSTLTSISSFLLLFLLFIRKKKSLKRIHVRQVVYLIIYYCFTKKGNKCVDDSRIWARILNSAATERHTLG